MLDDPSGHIVQIYYKQRDDARRQRV